MLHHTLSQTLGAERREELHADAAASRRSRVVSRVFRRPRTRAAASPASVTRMAAAGASQASLSAVRSDLATAPG